MAWFTSPAPTQPLSGTPNAGHTQRPTAPGPVSLAAPAPPDANLAASTAAGQAQLAAAKQRKRATSGGNTAATPSSIGAPGAVLATKTLLGY